jgi:hypothetical protein
VGRRTISNISQISNITQGASHFCSPPLEIGVRSQESGEKRKKEEGRSQKKCFYKYEMLPITQAIILSNES